MISKLSRFTIIIFLTIILLPEILNVSAIHSAQYISYEEFNSFRNDLQNKREVLAAEINDFYKDIQAKREGILVEINGFLDDCYKNIQPVILDDIKVKLIKYMPKTKKNINSLTVDAMSSDNQKDTLLVIGDLPMDIWKRIGDTNNKIDGILNLLCKDFHNYFSIHNLGQRFTSPFLTYEKKEKLVYRSLSCSSLDISKKKEYIRILAQQITIDPRPDTKEDKPKFFDWEEYRTEAARKYKKRDKLLMSVLWYVYNDIFACEKLIQFLNYDASLLMSYILCNNIYKDEATQSLYKPIDEIECRIREVYMNVVRQNYFFWSMNTLKCDVFKRFTEIAACNIVKNIDMENSWNIGYSFACAIFLNDWSYIKDLCSNKTLLEKYVFFKPSTDPCFLHQHLIAMAIMENSKEAFLILIKENPFKKCDDDCPSRRTKEPCINFFFRYALHDLKKRAGEKRWEKYYKLFKSLRQ